ncbi:MAG: hypothetical protein IPN10_13710 [Saprospiraceae bacterium]|nr:hypothetical protein [Saprospiraceae bacterium]
MEKKIFLFSLFMIIFGYIIFYFEDKNYLDDLETLESKIRREEKLSFAISQTQYQSAFVLMEEKNSLESLRRSIKKYEEKSKIIPDFWKGKSFYFWFIINSIIFYLTFVLKDEVENT